MSTVVARDAIEMIRAVFSGTSTAAPSPVLPSAMLTPVGARMSPMTMMTGPVTMGGRSRVMIAMPRQRMRKLNTT